MNRRQIVSIAGILMLIVAVGTGAHAQWPTSSATPLVIADLSADQVQPKIIPHPDGGFYVSWFDNWNGGYDVYLQRLDVAGNELWAHNGVLVADRGFGSTQEYGLSIDTAGNALLAFRYDRLGPVEIFVFKVGPDGTLLWGTDGVQVSTGGVFVASPRVTGTTDGGVAVAWTSENNVIINKLDAAGTAQWPAPETLVPAVGSFSVADLHASDAGTAILSFVHMTGSFPSPSHIWAQKFAAANGNFVWAPSHVQVYDQAGGSLQIANYPPFVPDGAGGAVFAWYTSSPSLQCRVQRILANGNEAFPHQGVEVSTNAAQIRVSPSAAFNAATQEIFVAWREQNTGQSQSALYAQKLDAAGNRQWTDNGSQLMPLAADEITNVTTLVIDDGALVSWVHTPSFGNGPVYSIRVDGSGNFAWQPPIAEICILPSNSSDLVGAMGAEGYAAYAWSDDNGAGDDIYAANLNGDGSLGYTGSIFSDGFEDGTTDGWSNVVP